MAAKPAGKDSGQVKRRQNLEPSLKEGSADQDGGGRGAQAIAEGVVQADGGRGALSREGIFKAMGQDVQNFRRKKDGIDLAGWPRASQVSQV